MQSRAGSSHLSSGLAADAAAAVKVGVKRSREVDAFAPAGQLPKFVFRPDGSVLVLKCDMGAEVGMPPRVAWPERRWPRWTDPSPSAAGTTSSQYYPAKSSDELILRVWLDAERIAARALATLSGIYNIGEHGVNNVVATLRNDSKVHYELYADV